ncbi:MAG: hypothetical protein WCP20_11215 [Desulfuromonadales bacterium]
MHLLFNSALLHDIGKVGIPDCVLLKPEQWDGSGYHGLKGDEIPISGCLMALADIYDARDTFPQLEVDDRGIITSANCIIPTGQNLQNIEDDMVVFINASDFGEVAGEIREITLESLSDSIFSTHRIPLPLIAGLITSETGAECRCNGIQPLSMALGEGLSLEVELATAKIMRALGGRQGRRVKGER